MSAPLLVSTRPLSAPSPAIEPPSVKLWSAQVTAIVVTLAAGMIVEGSVTLQRRPVGWVVTESEYGLPYGTDCAIVKVAALLANVKVSPFAEFASTSP